MADVPGVVFTDMDATLLDHATYDFTPAMPALEALEDEGVELVLCSSKTRAELEYWQRKLEITGPFISENGGGVFHTGFQDFSQVLTEKIDGLPAKTLGRSYLEVRNTLDWLRRKYPGGIRGFGDMEVEEIANLTGLHFKEADMASQRDFDEPFVWEPTPEPETAMAFREDAERLGFKVTRGGRFWHLMGRSDKGYAVDWVLKNLFPGARSLALGDNRNDLEMLARADKGVLVEQPGGGHLAPRPLDIECIDGVGPSGWAKAVLEWIDTI